MNMTTEALTHSLTHSLTVVSQASGCIGGDLSTHSVIKLFEAKPDMVFTEAVEVLRKVSAWAGAQAEEAMELLVVGYPSGGVARGRLAGMDCLVCARDIRGTVPFILILTKTAIFAVSAAQIGLGCQAFTHPLLWLLAGELCIV